jgi:serine/threonine protein kinase/Tol biopolymer transport system component
MTLSAGTRLGRYEIRSQIGAGGMGEVYLAQDAKLDRKVALKILPAEAAADQDRMRRFTQEARAAAALNHPNIAHVYEIDEADGLHYIAMEFIDGMTLREKIHRDHVELRKLLKHLTQVAEALAKAHSAGIVHRDLKPDNIMITRDDYAKILDFGLAKLIETQRPTGYGDAAPNEVATALMVQQSLPGTVLGTVGYMSPEQAQGRVDEIDHRSDIFSFGCILYEVATGQRAFQGKDALDSLHKIVHAPTPQIGDTNPTAPAELQRIVRRCLAKDPDKRYQSIKDVAIELEEALEELKRAGELEYSVQPSSTPPPARELEVPPSGAQLTGARSSPETRTPSAIQSAAGAAEVETARPTSSAEYVVSQIKRHKYGSAIIFALVLIVIASVGFGMYRLVGQKKTTLSFQSAKFTRLTSTGKATGAAISPDGKWLVHVIDDGGQKSLWLRQVAIANSNTQVVPPAEVHYWGVAFSPDGNYVYYSVSERNVQRGILYQVPVLGGTARKLLAGVDSSVAFSHDGKQMAFFRFYGDEDRLMIANADGTGERQLAMRHGKEYFFVEDFSGVSWSPDGKTLASPVVNAAENYMSVVTVSVESGEIKFFTPQKWNQVMQVAWLADGKSLLVTAREQFSSPYQIWQVSYPAGEAQRITNDLNSYRNFSLTADSSVLATVQTETVANIWVTPANDNAHAGQITQGRNFDSALSWTPDGKIVYASDANGSADIYSIDSRGGAPKQLTLNSRANIQPSVSPDGRYIVFSSDRTVGPHIWRMDADGGNPRQLTNQPDSTPHCSPDNQSVVYVSNSNKFTIWKVSINGGQPVQLSDKETTLPTFSPDGKQIASTYREDPNSPLKLAILSLEGGQPIKTFALPTQLLYDTNLRWSTDGRAIVYAVTRGGIANLWAQPVDGSPPKQLTNFTSDRIFWFDFSRDGKQLALARGTQTSDVVLISGFK